MNKRYTKEEQAQMDARKRSRDFHRRLVLVSGAIAAGAFVYWVVDSGPSAQCMDAGFFAAFFTSYFFSLHMLAAGAVSIGIVIWLMRSQGAGILEALASAAIPVIVAFVVSFEVWSKSIEGQQCNPISPGHIRLSE